MSVDDSELASIVDTSGERLGEGASEQVDEQPTVDMTVSKETNERRTLEARFRGCMNRHDRAIAIGLPVLLLLVFLEVLLWSSALWKGETVVTDLIQDPLLANTLRVLVLLAVVAALSLYYLRCRIPLDRARQALQDYDERILRERIGNRDEWRRYLQEEVRQLTHEISRVFIDNPKRFAQAKRLLKQADEKLEDTNERDLVEAQTQISSTKKLILAEEDDLRGQRKWRLFAVAVAIAYAAALAVFDIAARSKNTGYNELDADDVTLFGIPLLVLAWGAIGSLAAILYRFYTEEERVQFDAEIRWLIARPIVGIIMGAVSYLAVVSGLLSLTGQDISNVAQTSKTVLWILAFLAGFSDKFYIGIIDLLVHRTVVGNQGQADGT